MKAKAITLREAAKRLGYSYRHAQRLMSTGLFPVPALPRRALGRWLFSEVHIDAYLGEASTAEAEKGAAA